MARLVPATERWIRFLESVRIVNTRSYCTSKNNKLTNINQENGIVDHEFVNKFDAYKNLEKLDFKTAAKILFTAPPKEKKFGFDFHLVQFFFACMPSLAVYLVAQYARYQMRIMDTELEVKKKAEEAKAKDIEAKAAEEKELESDSKLIEVKARLDKLEETIKDIAVQSKMTPISSANENQEKVVAKKHNNVPIEEENPESSSLKSNLAHKAGTEDKGHFQELLIPATTFADQNQKIDFEVVDGRVCEYRGNSMRKPCRGIKSDCWRNDARNEISVHYNSSNEMGRHTYELLPFQCGTHSPLFR